ncbi:MAG: NAD(P)/FAD-dependent oxidoreductase [Candidatus Promineifilaceae bacterium]
MSKSSDVIVIGGGIMGCSAALQLARRGLDVTLLEKNTIGAGPTGESSAIIRQHYSNELTARMALYSLGVFQNFGDEVGGECGFTRTGFIALAPSADSQGLKANVAMQRRVGIHAELLTSSELKDVAPGLNTDDIVIAAYEPDSGYADPYLTVNSYAQAARNAGATIHQETAVTGITFSSGRVAGVTTAKGELSAPVVLNCTGAWAAQVARMTNHELPINPCRVQVAFFKRPAGEEASHPVVADFINATYFRSETGQLTLVGLIDPSEAAAVVNPDQYRKAVDDAFVLEVGSGLVQRYPAMERGQLVNGYASLYAITPDWHPIVDELPAGSGFFVCSGFSGHGFKLGPAVGVMVADRIQEVERPLFDSFLFRYSRFAEEQPVRGQYEYSIVG